MDGSEFRITKELIGDRTNVSLCGEIDIYTCQTFKSELTELVKCSKGDLFIDCKELTYIDSTGLGILVGALKEIRKDNNNIYICNLRDNIKKLFIITGLDKLFIID